MDSFIGWLFMLVAVLYGAFALTKAVIAEVDRKAREGEADWLRIEAGYYR